MTKSFASAIAFVGVLAALAGCSKKDSAKVEPEDASAAPLTTIANAVVDGGIDAAASEGDDVEPVYPIEPNAAPHPLAQRLCETLQELPEKKRAACCSTSPGIAVTSECTRMLSAAIRFHAVAIAEADVDACARAFDETLAGCDWVGPFPPGPPAACMGIVKGTVAPGQRCRSSLECAGDLRCLGVGPTTAGKCGPAKANGDLCGGTVDTLASYLRQSDLDQRHPECRDKCIKHKCGDAVAQSGACLTTSDCASGLQCIAKKCAARALPTEGEPCPGAVCAGGLQCIRGKCTARKAAGEACTSDFECRGGCVAGRCGARCDIR